MEHTKSYLLIAFFMHFWFLSLPFIFSTTSGFFNTLSNFMYYFRNSVKRKKLESFTFKTLFSRRFRQERVTSSSSVMDRASSVHLYCIYLLVFYGRIWETEKGGCVVVLQCEVCTGAGSRYFCRRAAGWRGMYDVHRILAAGYIGAD